MGGHTCHWTLNALLIFTAAFLILVDASDLRDLKVQCSRSGLTVHVTFDEPFDGLIYSRDFYQNPKCTYVTANNNGRTTFSFSVPLKGCGTISQLGGKSSNSLAAQRSLDVSGDELFLENTIIIQRDPDIQEVGDTARRLRCVWRNALQKSVNAKLNQVGIKPSVISVRYDYQSVDKLVEVQSGSRGPLQLPATGFINSMPTFSSLALYLKDGTQRFDANILSCTYSSGRGDTVALTSDEGCALRPDLTTPFYKMRETANPNSELTLYAYFRALQIPRDGLFSINCRVEICPNRCPERCRLQRRLY